MKLRIITHIGSEILCPASRTISSGKRRMRALPRKMRKTSWSLTLKFLGRKSVEDVLRKIKKE